MTVDPVDLGDQRQDAAASRLGALRYLPLVLIAAAIVAVFATGTHRQLRFEVLLDHWAALTGFVAAHPVLAALTFIAAFVTFIVISLPGAALFSMTSGLLFGWLIGGALAVTSATIGAMIVFLVARTAFGALLARRAGSLLARLAEGFRRDAFNYLLFLRLVPAFPFWLVNLAPALLGVPLRSYAAATAIGVVPGTFAFAFIGAGLKSFMVEHAAMREACLAAGRGGCAVAFHPAELVSPYALIGLGVLGVIALVPVALRRWAGTRRSTG